jgi:hypothetical protein
MFGGVAERCNGCDAGNVEYGVYAVTAGNVEYGTYAVTALDERRYSAALRRGAMGATR